MSVDRSWMKRRINPDDGSVTQEFKDGVKEFLEFAFNHPRAVGRVKIKCPCFKCELLKLHKRDVITLHLYKWGFRNFYSTWYAHGEVSTPQAHQDDVTNDGVQGANVNRYTDMVIEDEAVPTTEGFYQENEMPSPTVVGLDVDLDDVITLPSTEVEEVEHEDVPRHIINPSNSELDPDNIDQEDWEDILKSWMKPEWQKRSKVGVKNRKKVLGVEAELEEPEASFKRDETWIEPTEIELFKRVHKLNKGKGEWCDARGENVHSKYHDIVKEKNTSEVEISDEGITTDANLPLPAPPAFDAQAWVNATGDLQKTVYKFGLTKEAENIHKHVKPSSTKKTTFHASTSANNESNNEPEIAKLKRENAALKASIEQILKTLKMQQDTIKLEDVVATLNSRKLQKMTEAKGDGGEGFYVSGRSGQRDMEHVTYSTWSKSQGRSSGLKCYICQSEEHLKRDCPSYGYDNVDVLMAMSVEELLDWIMDSGGSYHITYMRDSLVDLEEYDGGNILLGDGRECHIQSGKIKVKKGSLMVLSGTRRSICVYTLDGQAVTRNTLKDRKQLGEYQTRWKIKTGNVLDSHNQRSTQQCMKSGVAKHLGISGLSKVFWAEDTTMSTYLVNRSPSSAIGFKTPIDMLGFFGWLASIKQGMLEPVKVKCIFLGYRKGIVGNKLWRFDDVTSKVVLYKNMGFNESGEYKKTFIGFGVGTGLMQVLQGVEFEVEPQEDHTFKVEPHRNVDHVVGSQEVQTQDLIYYHPTRDREQHSAWELFSYREDSNEAAFAVAEAEKIYAHESLTFNNTVACEAEIWVTKGLLVKAKGNVLGMEIVRDQSGDCDVENNGKWSCIYTVGSQEYEMVCTRLDIASADVDQSQAGYMTITKAAKEVIRLKGLAIESGFELKIVAGIATGALSKAIPSPRFQYRLKLLRIKDF
ncbi:zinc finger, CCHC-type containing protein [Tanacetum coccineum]